ncbi:MAG TPA: hypothetical protein VD902_04170 [Symbiobacteriaceae bacterium]|nr:hypothetical protein [Symbiobacteriaceae bacterium]
MQGFPGQQPIPPDPGALAMRSATEMGELSTIAASQLIGGLSGLLVSEGLSRVVREIMGISAGVASPHAAGGEGTPTAEGAAPQATEVSEGESLAGLSAKALKEMVASGVVGRILALNSLNTYLSLAAAEQLRRMGAHLAAGGTLPQVPAATTPPPQWPPQWPPQAGQVPYHMPGPVSLGSFYPDR